MLMSVKGTLCVMRTHVVEILQGATCACAMMAIREMGKFAMVVFDQNFICLDNNIMSFF